MTCQYNSTLLQSIYELFGGLKKKWPGITTIATLDWQSLPPNAPVDIWVDDYADYGMSDSYLHPTPKELLRQRWLAENPRHQYWWYARHHHKLCVRTLRILLP